MPYMEEVEERIKQSNVPDAELMVNLLLDKVYGNDTEKLIKKTDIRILDLNDIV